MTTLVTAAKETTGGTVVYNFQTDFKRTLLLFHLTFNRNLGIFLLTGKYPWVTVLFLGKICYPSGGWTLPPRRVSH